MPVRCSGKFFMIHPLMCASTWQDNILKGKEVHPDVNKKYRSSLNVMHAFMVME